MSGKDSILRVMTTDDVEQELKRKVQMRDIQWVDPLLEPVVISIDYARSQEIGGNASGLLTKDKRWKSARIGLKLMNTAILLLFPRCVMTCQNTAHY